MTEMEILRLLLARRENYHIEAIQHIRGRAYSIVIASRTYRAIIVSSSFDFYEMRYHLGKQVPDLIICHTHNTVVPIRCLSLKAGRIADPYDLPAHIVDVERQRHRSKTGSQVLLGMYLLGMKAAQNIIHNKDFPPTTRKRYLQRAKELSNRKPGRPAGILERITP